MITLEVQIENEDMGCPIEYTYHLDESYISGVGEDPTGDHLLVEYNGAFYKTKEVDRLEELISYIGGNVSFEFNPDIEKR